MLKLLGSQNLTAGNLVIPVAKGNYKSFVFAFIGTAAGGATVAATDLGNVNIQRDGETLCNVDAQDLVNINNYESGLDRTSSITAGLFDFTVRFNVGFADDKNYSARFDRDKGIITVTFGATLAAKVAAGTLAVYGDTSKGVELYYTKLLDFSQVIGVTGTQISPLLNQKNVQFIYFRTAADVGSIQITKDNYALCNATGQTLRDDTQYKGRTEADITFIYQELNQTKQIPEILSSVIQFYITSASGGGTTLPLLYKQVVYNPTQASASIQSYKNFETNKLSTSPQAQAVKALTQTAAATPVRPQPVQSVGAGASA